MKPWSCDSTSALFCVRRLDLDSARQAATQVVPDARDRLLAAGDDEVDLVPDARPVHHPARRAERHRGEALAAEVQPARELEQADHSQSLDARGGREPHAVAEIDPVGVGPASLEVDLQPVLRPASGDRARVGELGGPGALAGDVQLLGGVGRGLAGAVDEGEDAEHDSLRLLDAGRAPDLAERRVADGVAADAGDDQVGPPVDRVEEVVEGAVDRRREQQDAEDHRHAEHDPGGGQQRAQSPRAHLPKREGAEGAHQGCGRPAPPGR